MCHGEQRRYERNYRDVMLNVEMLKEDGTPFLCEVQVTLSGITILKKSLDFHRVLRIWKLRNRNPERKIAKWLEVK